MRYKKSSPIFRLHAYLLKLNLIKFFAHQNSGSFKYSFL